MPAEIERKKKEIIRKLALDKETQHLYSTIADFTYLKTSRKDGASKAYYLLDDFISKIANRLNITKLQFYDMHEEEVEDALLNGRIDSAAIAKRQEKYAIYVENGNKREIEDNELNNILSGVIKKGRQQTRQKITGDVACTGNAIGIVKKILRPEDMDKMNQDDILVSHATTPDILPAMKRAAAIITEDGGITSHAAVVAREFNIPCVIGTETAMQLLEDGDLVNVDADNGIITLIEESSIQHKTAKKQTENDFEIYGG